MELTLSDTWSKQEVGCLPLMKQTLIEAVGRMMVATLFC